MKPQNPLKDEIDSSVPPQLLKNQIWFANIITRPIDENSRMMPISPLGQPMENEAKEYIKPSHTLQPHQRIELYNQQYWWRLLKILQETFPTLTRLFGYESFNQILAIPYLQAYPPNHWSLNYLGSRLPIWIKESYKEEDRDWLFNIALLELAINDLFFEPALQSIKEHMKGKEEDIPLLLDRKLILQPYIKLFIFSHDLPSYRKELLKESVEHWIENDFPPLSIEGEYPFVVYRNSELRIFWVQIPLLEYRTLQFFEKGCSIEEASDEIERWNPREKDEAEQNLALWFQKWVQNGWLTLIPNVIQ